MTDERSVERRVRNPLTGERAIPASSGAGGAALAAAGATVGAMGAFAGGAAVGSAAGPIGAAIGAVIGAVAGVTLEHRAEQRANPEPDANRVPVASDPPASGHERNSESLGIRTLSPTQQEAILDLTVMAMYVDGHITTSEEERVYRLLRLLGCSSDYDCAQAYDQAVTRVRQHLQSSQTAARHAVALVEKFPLDAEKRLVREVLQDFLACDGSIGAEEGRLLSALGRSE
jgi:uncharacterized membrane protein YebE (DUF533 family)